MPVLNFDELRLSGKKLLIREDLNVPLQGGRITSDARIRAALPTIATALNRDARVMVMSHLGRPEEAVPIQEQLQFSLAPVAKRMSELLQQEVRLVRDWLTDGSWQDDLRPGQVFLLENVRVNQGERANDPDLSRKMAELADVFVMDAFGTAHRVQASTVGVARYAKVACAGPLLTAELNALGGALANPGKLLLAIVGGSKVSSKLQVLDALSEKVDRLIIGGGIANTFLQASGINVGKSLVEIDLLGAARQLMAKAEVMLPVDVIVGKDFSADAAAVCKGVDGIGANEMILDIGPETAALYGEVISKASTVIWNGPVGVFEFERFARGTETVARAIAASKAFSLAGGGDTLAAIDKYQLNDQISYVSTGGGAFLEFVQGKKLPAVAVLEDRFDPASA